MRATPTDIDARRGRAASAAADLDTVTGAVFAGRGFTNPRLALDWDAIVGLDVSRLTLPLKLSGGVLTLKTEPAAAAFLALETRAICDRINAYLGRPAVVRLKFVQGPLAIRPVTPTRRQPPATALAPDDPAQGFRGPENLRQAIVKLARARRRWPILPADPPD